VIAFSPPLSTPEDVLDRIVSIIGDSLDAVT
jgi:4-aminobutyrate aminotransferase-like enzyme